MIITRSQVKRMHHGAARVRDIHAPRGIDRHRIRGNEDPQGFLAEQQFAESLQQ
jgi:hypothetical protein